jgi:hypothetical protein
MEVYLCLGASDGEGPGMDGSKGRQLVVVCAIKSRCSLCTALDMMAVHLSFRRLRHVRRLAALAGCLHVVSSLVVALAARLGVTDTKLLSLLARIRSCPLFFINSLYITKLRSF